MSMLCTYMKKISITFNDYEYKYLKHARDIINRNELQNASIKDVLFSFLTYTIAKIQDGRHLNRFLNIFLIKNNAKPLEENEEKNDTHLYKKFNDIYLTALPKPNDKYYSTTILYVLRLNDNDISLLDSLIEVIHDYIVFNGPSYSEIFRNAVHFVIDIYTFKKEFYSVLYLLSHSSVPADRVPDLMSYIIESKKSRPKKIDNKKNKQYEEWVSTDLETFSKLKPWILKTKIEENEEEYKEIQKSIGMFYDGTYASGEFINFIFFLNNLYADLVSDYILTAHYSFQEAVNNNLEDAKNLYISIREQIFKFETDD